MLRFHTEPDSKITGFRIWMQPRLDSFSGGLFVVDVVSDVDRFDLRVAAELGEGFV